MATFVIVGLIGGFICAVIAAGKNRNPLLWFLAGALFPLISLLIVLASDPVPELGVGDAFRPGGRPNSGA